MNVCGKEIKGKKGGISQDFSYFSSFPLFLLFFWGFLLFASRLCVGLPNQESLVCFARATCVSPKLVLFFRTVSETIFNFSLCVCSVEVHDKIVIKWLDCQAKKSKGPPASNFNVCSASFYAGSRTFYEQGLAEKGTSLLCPRAVTHDTWQNYNRRSVKSVSSSEISWKIPFFFTYLSSDLSGRVFEC